MRYMVNRLLGLMNRKVQVYQKLVIEMKKEKSALLDRNLELLQDSLGKQHRLVDELRDIARDISKEMEGQSSGAARAKTTLRALAAAQGKQGDKILALKDKADKLARKARKLNQENKQIIEVSHSFFTFYIEALSQIRTTVFGYEGNGKAMAGRTGNLLVDQHS